MLGPQHQLRQAEIERLSSPDQLDLPMRVTSPVTWLLLGGIALILAFVVYWLIAGSLPEKVEGEGMILAIGEQVQTIQAPAKGKLKTLNVKVGDQVEVDSLIAVMQLPDLEAQINAARERVRDLSSRDSRQSGQFSSLRATYQTQLADAIEDVRRMKELQRRGVVALPRVREAEARKAEIESKLLNIGLGNDDIGLQLGDARRQLAVLLNQVEGATVTENGNVVTVEIEVKSHTSGKVAARLVREGQLLELGQRLVNLEGIVDVKGSKISDQGENAVREPKRKFWLFVPFGDGKKLRPGLEVKIAPLNIQPEDFGYMRGTVKFISSQPVTPEEVLSLFNNDEMARRYAKDSPYMVEVELRLLERATTDQDSPSNEVERYQWTSRRGEELPIESNTPCKAQIIVEDRKPYTLVIPKLKQLLSVS